MNITIVTKDWDEKSMSPVTKEYKKRLGGYCKVDITNRLPSKRAYKISTREKNAYITSEDFAKKISDVMIDGYSQIAFFVDEPILGQDYGFSLTSLDLSGDMYLCVMLEQIYRAFKINNNEAYHK